MRDIEVLNLKVKSHIRRPFKWFPFSLLLLLILKFPKLVWLFIRIELYEDEKEINKTI